MIHAVLSNAQHPEYGVLTAPFPIPAEQYDEIIGMLHSLEIGDERKRDCKVDELKSATWPVLKRLEKVAVNIDELDYLPNDWTASTWARRHSFRPWRSRQVSQI